MCFSVVVKITDSFALCVHSFNKKIFSSYILFNSIAAFLVSMKCHMNKPDLNPTFGELGTYRRLTLEMKQ